MPTVLTLEPLLVAITMLRVSAHRTPLTRVRRVNPRGRDSNDALYDV